MDYIQQVELILTYLKFNLEFDEIELLLKLKKDFNNDLNLIGCFLKDYLILNYKKQNFDDNCLYKEFVLYFDENKENYKEILNSIIKYSKYYLMLVFEYHNDVQILSMISTINLCYAMDCYPLIMQILHDMDENITDINSAITMLKSISTNVLNRFEDNKNYDIDFYNVTIDTKGNLYCSDKAKKVAV